MQSRANDATQQLLGTPAPPATTPLVVLTGFLGSGKTTLLNRLLSDPAMRDTAVIVNEFGEIGIDHLLVQSVADDVVLLASGCVCCSSGDDLTGALASILDRRATGAVPSFRRIVLETTGIADPAPLLRRLLSDERLAAAIRIHGVVTIVDAVFGRTALSRFPECASQVAMANRLIISKLDLVERDEIDSLVACLRSMTAAPIVHSNPAGRAAVNCLFDEPEAGLTFTAWAPSTPALRGGDGGAGPGLGPVVGHGARFVSFSLRWSEPTAWPDLTAWLEGLLIARGEQILRLKGIIRIAGCAQPVLIQGVQHALYPPQPLTIWPHGAPGSELVFITRDFPRDAALRSFQQCLPDAASVAGDLCHARISSRHGSPRRGGHDRRLNSPRSAIVAEPSPASWERTGVRRAETLLPDGTVRFLQHERSRLHARIAAPRPWHYAELHNPWSRAAAAFDSWGFLDICQSSTLLEAVTAMLGADIVLFDSEWLPNPWQSKGAVTTWESDDHRFPVEPRRGLTALIGFADGPPDAVRVDCQPLPLDASTQAPQTAFSLPLQRADVIFLDRAVPYHIRSVPENGPPAVYAIRYFPASSRYNREADAGVHRALTSRHPLINFARMPLWLVHGEDRAGNDFVTGFDVRAGFWTPARA